MGNKPGSRCTAPAASRGVRGTIRAAGSLSPAIRGFRGPPSMAHSLRHSFAARPVCRAASLAFLP